MQSGPFSVINQSSPSIFSEPLNFVEETPKTPIATQNGLFSDKFEVFISTLIEHRVNINNQSPRERIGQEIISTLKNYVPKRHKEINICGGETKVQALVLLRYKVVRQSSTNIQGRLQKMMRLLIRTPIRENGNIRDCFQQT